MWSAALDALKQVNVAIAVPSSEGGEEERGRTSDGLERTSSCNGNYNFYAGASAPALQGASDALRQVIQGELQGMVAARKEPCAISSDIDAAKSR